MFLRLSFHKVQELIFRRIKEIGVFEKQSPDETNDEQDKNRRTHQPKDRFVEEKDPDGHKLPSPKRKGFSHRLYKLQGLNKLHWHGSLYDAESMPSGKLK